MTRASLRGSTSNFASRRVLSQAPAVAGDLACAEGPRGVDRTAGAADVGDHVEAVLAAVEAVAFQWIELDRVQPRPEIINARAADDIAVAALADPQRRLAFAARIAADGDGPPASAPALPDGMGRK